MRDDDLDDATAAYHEAGHVVMAALLGAEVVATTIEDERDDGRGHTTVRWRRVADAERTRRSALVALAGPVAEARWRRDGDVAEQIAAWHGDFDEVQAALRVLLPPEAHERALATWLAEVRRALAEPDVWERLCRVADHLEAHGALDRDLLDDLL